jgi:hypothetical protein
MITSNLFIDLSGRHMALYPMYLWVLGSPQGQTAAWLQYMRKPETSLDVISTSYFEVLMWLEFMAIRSSGPTLSLFPEVGAPA